MKELQELISLAKQVARPYFIACILLSILLTLSLAGNIYQTTLTCDVDIEQVIDNNSDNNDMDGINE